MQRNFNLKLGVSRRRIPDLSEIIKMRLYVYVHLRFSSDLRALELITNVEESYEFFDRFIRANFVEFQLAKLSSLARFYAVCRDAHTRQQIISNAFTRRTGIRRCAPAVPKIECSRDAKIARPFFPRYVRAYAPAELIFTRHVALAQGREEPARRRRRDGK